MLFHPLVIDRHQKLDKFLLFGQYIVYGYIIDSKIKPRSHKVWKTETFWNVDSNIAYNDLPGAYYSVLVCGNYGPIKSISLSY